MELNEIMGHFCFHITSIQFRWNGERDKQHIDTCRKGNVRIWRYCLFDLANSVNAIYSYLFSGITKL